MTKYFGLFEYPEAFNGINKLLKPLGVILKRRLNRRDWGDQMEITALYIPGTSTFEQKVKEAEANLRYQALIEALATIEKAVREERVTMISFAPTKAFGSNEPVVIDYSVDFDPDKFPKSNISDLNAESVEAVIIEIAERIMEIEFKQKEQIDERST